MKRHPILQPLSRDHHNVLVHARRLRGLDARVDPERARQAFLAYHGGVLLHHFAEEEQLLRPKVRDRALFDRLAAEHAELRALTEALAAGAGDALLLGQRLREHVRFEEDVLFPHLEATLGPGEWDDLARQGEAFRAVARPSSLAGGEACFL